MFEIKVRVLPNTNKELDPTFGNLLPDESDAFIIFVTPTLTKQKEWYFIVMLPEELEKESAKDLIRAILPQVLSKGEKYDVRSFSQDHAKLLNSATPILSHHPEFLGDSDIWDFYWIVPPLSKMN